MSGRTVVVRGDGEVDVRVNWHPLFKPTQSPSIRKNLIGNYLSRMSARMMAQADDGGAEEMQYRWAPD